MLELSTAFPFAQSGCFDKAYAGDAYNTAIALQRLGTATGFLTRLGSDAFSDDVLTQMQTMGLMTDWIRQIPGQLGLYLASYARHEHWQAQYYRHGSAATQLHPDDLPYNRLYQAKQQGLQAVYSTGVTLAISKTARLTVQKAFKLARRHGILTAFDINYRPALWTHTTEAIEAVGSLLCDVDILTTSLEDIQPLLGISNPSHILEYCHRKGVQWLVLRLPKGQCLLGHVTGHQHHFHQLSGEALVQPVQSIGAGDAFNAGLLHALLQGKSLMDAGQFALSIARQKLLSNETLLSAENASGCSLEAVA